MPENVAVDTIGAWASVSPPNPYRTLSSDDDPCLEICASSWDFSLARLAVITLASHSIDSCKQKSTASLDPS